MGIVKCLIQGCAYQTEDVEPAVVAALLQLHATEHSGTGSKASVPSLDRPRIDTGVSLEEWNSFVRRWDAYRTGSRISDDIAAVQFFQCASNGLADILLKSDPNVTSRSLASVLTAMRLLAVVPVCRGVTRADLMRMTQANDETFRHFAGRVRGKAETCEYVTVA